MATAALTPTASIEGRPGGPTEEMMVREEGKTPLYIIRALAAVVHFADTDTFKELRDEDGGFRMQAIQHFATELGIDLDDTDLTPLRKALAGQEHMRYSSQDLGLLTQGSLTDALKLTVTIDGECQLLGLNTRGVLDAVISTHVFLSEHMSTVFNQQAAPIFGLCIGALTVAMREIQRSLLNKVDRLATASSRLPPKQKRLVTGHNATLRTKLEHVRWITEVIQKPFNAEEYFCGKHEDRIALQLWKAHVGVRTAATTWEKFLPALQSAGMPDYALSTLRSGVCPCRSGIVSAYSFRRFLRLWGPFAVLLSNLDGDFSSRFIDLESTVEEAQLDLEGMPAGTYVVVPSRKEGQLEVVFVTQGLRIRAAEVSKEKGSWRVPMLNKTQYFETVRQCVDAFPTLWTTPLMESSNGGPPEGEAPAAAFPGSFRSASEAAMDLLHRACYKSDTEQVSMLLESGGFMVMNSSHIDPYVSHTFSWSPLHCAVNNGVRDPHEIVKLLLDGGADPWAVDESQCSPLYYAITNGYGRSVRVLLERNPTLRTSPTTHPLLLACGPHYFHNGSDNFLTGHVYPKAEVLTACLQASNTRDLTWIDMILEILMGKLHGTDPRPTEEWTRHEAANFLLTEQQMQLNDEQIRHHGCQCRFEHRAELLAAIKGVSAWRFFVSSQNLKTALQAEASKTIRTTEAQQEAGGAPEPTTDTPNLLNAALTDPRHAGSSHGVTVELFVPLQFRTPPSSDDEQEDPLLATQKQSVDARFAVFPMTSTIAQ